MAAVARALAMKMERRSEPLVAGRVIATIEDWAHLRRLAVGVMGGCERAWSRSSSARLPAYAYIVSNLLLERDFSLHLFVLKIDFLLDLPLFQIELLHV